MAPPPNYWELSETETTFHDLQCYAEAQNMAIQTLYEINPEESNPVFIQSKIPTWNAVWKATWKKGENTFHKTIEVQRDNDHRFDDTLLSETIPVHCNIAELPEGLAYAWGFNCKSLFIRHDYEEALRAVLWGCSYKGPVPYDNIIYSGSPGIGKSGFLLLVLLWRLAAGLPTALQIHHRYALLFWEGGVLDFVEPDIRTYYTSLGGTGDPRSRIWMLADSNHDLTQPTGAFSGCGPFFVVVAASPRPELRQWTKKTISFVFYMKPWSFSEILQARTLVIPDNPPSESDLWALYSDYCPSPRDLFSWAMCPEIYIKLVEQELEKVSPELERRLLENPNHALDASDLLVLIEPLPTSRFVPNRRIVTDHVSQLLLQKRRHIESCRAKGRPSHGFLAGIF